MERILVLESIIKAHYLKHENKWNEEFRWWLGEEGWTPRIAECAFWSKSLKMRELGHSAWGCSPSLSQTGNQATGLDSADTQHPELAVIHKVMCPFFHLTSTLPILLFILLLFFLPYTWHWYWGTHTWERPYIYPNCTLLMAIFRQGAHCHDYC